MSDVAERTEGVSSAPAAAAPDPAAATAAKAAEDLKKKETAERVLVDILKLMELPARVELKDGADGGISVALFFDSEVPGVQAGRRSHLIDALQFLVNKVVNRPQTERRWISIGVGAHPEPRTQKPPAAPAPTAAAPMSSSVAAPPPSARPPAAPPAQSPRAARAAQRPNGQAGGAPAASPRPSSAPQLDETTMQVNPDPAVTRIGQALAERSSRLGRFYAVVSMKADDRARLMVATKDSTGVTVRAEGEGRARRVVFTPDKPTPMPKKTMPNYDEEDEELD